MSSPLFESCRPISEKCIQVNSFKPSIMLEKPISVGAAILELSKFDMYKMYYEVLTPAFKEHNDMQLLYTDTDSLIISIRSKDLKDDLNKIRDHIDFSNFCPDNELYSNDKAAKLGCIKIEMGAHKIIAGCFLKAKCYCLLIEPDEQQLKWEVLHNKKHGFVLKKNASHGELVRAKGVLKAKQKLVFMDYYNAYRSEIVKHVTSRRMKSVNHKVHWTDQTKMAFNSFDDKRYLLDCGACTTAYGSVQDLQDNDFCPCGGLGR